MDSLNPQNKTEKILYCAALVLAEFYLLPCVFRHMINTETWIDAQQWYALILSLAALVWWIAVKCPQLRQEEERRQFLQCFGSYEQVYVVCVFFWYIVSVALRQYTVGGTHFRDNDLWMFITGLVAFLFFPLARYAGKEKAKRTIETLVHTLVIPFAVFSVWLIWQYFNRNFVCFPSGRRLEVEPPAILMYTGVNHVSIGRQAMVMLGLSLYMVVTQKPWLKILYSLCLASFFVFLILTNVRTSWYMTAAMLTCAAFFFCWNRLENRKLLHRIAVGIVLAAAVALCCHLLRDGVFRFLEKAWTAEGGTAEITAPADMGAAPKRSARLEQALAYGPTDCSRQPAKLQTLANEPPADEAEAESSYKRTVSDNLFSFRERIALYRASIFVMFTSRYRFLFGVTPSDVNATLAGIYGLSRTYGYGHAHNFFLQMGVAFGVPTMIATIIFAVSLLVRSIRIMFINRRKVFSGAWMICLLTLTFLGADMFESGLNASPDFFCPAFYLFAGWLVSLDVDTRAPKKNGKHAGF